MFLRERVSASWPSPVLGGVQVGPDLPPHLASVGEGIGTGGALGLRNQQQVIKRYWSSKKCLKIVEQIRS